MLTQRGAYIISAHGISSPIFTPYSAMHRNVNVSDSRSGLGRYIYSPFLVSRFLFLSCLFLSSLTSFRAWGMTFLIQRSGTASSFSKFSSLSPIKTSCPFLSSLTHPILFSSFFSFFSFFSLLLFLILFIYLFIYQSSVLFSGGGKSAIGFKDIPNPHNAMRIINEQIAMYPLPYPLPPSNKNTAIIERET